MLKIRAEFPEELEAPLDHVNTPLLLVLCHMMTPFYNGHSPHYPVKKIFLLNWKIILTSIGGWGELREEKRKLREQNGMKCVEDTLVVAGHMKACTIMDGIWDMTWGRWIRYRYRSRLVMEVLFVASSLVDWAVSWPVLEVKRAQTTRQHHPLPRLMIRALDTS